MQPLLLSHFYDRDLRDRRSETNGSALEEMGDDDMTVEVANEGVLKGANF